MQQCSALPSGGKPALPLGQSRRLAQKHGARAAPGAPETSCIFSASDAAQAAISAHRICHLW